MGCSKKLKARSLLRAYARALSSRGDRSDDAAARMEAFRVAVRMTSDGRDSDGGGPDEAPDGLPALGPPAAGRSRGAAGGGGGGDGLDGLGDLQGVGPGGTAGLEPGALGSGGGGGPLTRALPGLSGGAGSGRGGLPGLALAAGGGGPLDGDVAARIAGAGLLSGSGPCRTGSSGDPCNNGPNPTTHPSSPDRSNPHADHAAAAAATAQLHDLQQQHEGGIYSSRPGSNGTIIGGAAARGGDGGVAADRNGTAPPPPLPPADRLVAALMQGTGVEDTGRLAGDGAGVGPAAARYKQMAAGGGHMNGPGGVNGGANGGDAQDAWGPLAPGGSGRGGAGAGLRNGQTGEGILQELQARGVPPQLLQQLLAKGVSAAALQAVLLEARMNGADGGMDEPGPAAAPLPLLAGAHELPPRELAPPRQMLDGPGRSASQLERSREDARATPPPPQRLLKLEREAQSGHDEAQRTADGAEPRVRVKAEALEDSGKAIAEDGNGRRQPPDAHDGAAAQQPTGSREDSGTGPSRQGVGNGREAVRAAEADQGGRAAKAQPQLSQGYEQQSLDSSRRGAGPAGSSRPQQQQQQQQQQLPVLAAGTIEAAARARGAMAAEWEGEASGNGNGAAASIRVLRGSDDDRLDGSSLGSRGPGPLQAAPRPPLGDLPSPMADVDARDSSSVLRALAAAVAANGGGGGHPLQALAAALTANGGSAGSLGGALASLAAGRDGGGGGGGRLEQLAAALVNGGSGGAVGPAGPGAGEQLGRPGGQGLAMLHGSGGGGGGGGGMLGTLLAEAQRGRAAAAGLGGDAEETALADLIRASLAEAEAAEAARARAANRALEAAARLMQVRQARARAGVQLPPESMLANALASARTRMAGSSGSAGGDELLSRLALLQSLQAGDGGGGAPGAVDLAAMLDAARGGGAAGSSGTNGAAGGGPKRHALSDDEREQLPPRKRHALGYSDDGPLLRSRGGGGNGVPLLPLHHLQLANAVGAGTGPGGHWGGDMLDAPPPPPPPPQQQQQFLADMRGLMSGLAATGGGAAGGRGREQQDMLDMLRSRAAAALAASGVPAGAGGGLGHLRGPPAGARGLLQEEEEDGPGPAAVATAMAAEAAALRRKGATGLLESQDSLGEMAQTLLGFSQMAAQTLGGGEPASGAGGGGGGGGGRKGQRW
ncbi:hypothetical protein HYH02_002199 [Chlamydomonas schloesseri]|uniref:Uncharacterized protein n=1 Tax=Chlamydomonas schloesseri TaxID=2026947 RepID=A0A835WT02_9CHLO|nr:hypothetical protein HYH02_002199 [Chlamydomonas schloesseri]|eukprot:KAG2452854.1 hypothetical protein HYH02_002199 [Chlamydomonas schloesseri]